ncbi:MAG TPA: hypothetical protein VF102_08430, partial [Gemmatimonadaceae bacterium]
MRHSISASVLVLAVAAACLTVPSVSAQREGDYTITNFHFADGESLRDLRIHYMTLGAGHAPSLPRSHERVALLELERRLIARGVGLGPISLG